MNQLEHQPIRLWSPEPRRAAGSTMARFWESARDTAGLSLESYDDLWAWSVNHPERFWPLIGGFFGVRAGGGGAPPRGGAEASGAGRVPPPFPEQNPPGFSRPPGRPPPPRLPPPGTPPPPKVRGGA